MYPGGGNRRGSGQDRGMGGGQGRGMGGGQGGGGQGPGGPGPSGNCVCPKCGKSFPHQRGVPCSQMKCPDCDTALTREF